MMADIVIGKAFSSTSTTADVTCFQLRQLFVKQKESWSAEPREHTTETAFSNTASNRTAMSQSPIRKNRLESPVGSIRNEKTRSRTNIRRSDHFSRKSLTKTDLERPTSRVDTALAISPAVCSRQKYAPIIQTTSMSRTPVPSVLSEEAGEEAKNRSISLSTIKKSIEDRGWSALKKESSIQLMTTKEPTSKTRTNQDMMIEKLTDGRVRVSVILNISASGKKLGVAAKAPDGMRIKSVTVNGAMIFSAV